MAFYIAGGTTVKRPKVYPDFHTAERSARSWVKRDPHHRRVIREVRTRADVASVSYDSLGRLWTDIISPALAGPGV